MPDDNRVEIVKRLLFEHLRSPSLRHIKDAGIVITLAQNIVRKLDRGQSVWTKWTGPREHLARLAVPCWIPTEDLRDHLNRVEGPLLTFSDVEQRLKAFADETYSEFPRDEFRAGCLEIYEHEKSQGTEMPAIVGVLRDHVEGEEERERLEHAARYAQLKSEQKAAARSRLLSGADCKWTDWEGANDVYCRVNGRLFRLASDADRRLNLSEIDRIDDTKGHLLGRYLKRGDATKAVAQIAYQPRPF